MANILKLNLHIIIVATLLEAPTEDSIPLFLCLITKHQQTSDAIYCSCFLFILYFI
jgi:hypothetical protein